MYNKQLGQALNYGQSMQPNKTKNLKVAAQRRGKPKKTNPAVNLRAAIMMGVR